MTKNITATGQAFAHKKVQQKTLSNQLRALREAEKLSIEDVAQRARVRRVYVAALEEGRLDALPADVYVRGFLRAIAVVLSTRPEALISLYDRERGIQRSLDQKKNMDADGTTPLQRHVDIYRAVVTPRHVVTMSIVLTAAVVGWYLYSVVHSFVGAPLLIVTAPTQEATVTTSQVTVSGQTDPMATLLLNDQGIVVERNGEFTTMIPLSVGANDISLRATNRFHKTTERHVRVYFAPQNPIVPDAPVSPETVTVRVKIADAPTWVVVTVDGTEQWSGTHTRGSENTFTGKDVRITSGNGQRTHIQQDGGAWKPLGDTPAPVREFVISSTSSSNTPTSATEEKTTGDVIPEGELPVPAPVAQTEMR